MTETKVLQENMRLVYSIARRFIGRGVDLEDLVQIGVIGLIKASRGFDESFGTAFSTYAVPKITGEIRQFLRSDGPVKISRSLREKSTHIRKISDEFEKEHHRPPKLSEIAAQSGYTPEEIAECESTFQPLQNIDDCHALGDGGIEEQLALKLALSAAVKTLPEVQQQVIYLRFYKGLTQESIAKALNLTQVKVSRLLAKSLEKMRLFL